MAYHVCLSHVGFSRIYFMLEESFLFLIEYFFVFSSDQPLGPPLVLHLLYSKNVFSSTDIHIRVANPIQRPSFPEGITTTS